MFDPESIDSLGWILACQCDWRVRLHRVSVGPLQLVSSPHNGEELGNAEPHGTTIPVALREGEVRVATDAELRAIAALLPKERDYAQLADVQRAVILKRTSGKTTKDKGRGQTVVVHARHSNS